MDTATIHERQLTLLLIFVPELSDALSDAQVPDKGTCFFCIESETGTEKETGAVLWSLLLISSEYPDVII